MITVEEKLSIFTQYLLRKQRELGQEKIGEAKDKCQVLIKLSNDRIAQDKRSIEERNYHVIFRDKNKIIAQGKNNAKNNKLALRSCLLDDFKKTIVNEAKSYFESDLYKAYLKKCIQNVPEILGEHEGLIIAVHEADLEIVKDYAESFLEKYQVEFIELDPLLTGGIKVKDSEEQISCDFTIENLVKENNKVIGLRLEKIIEKQV